MCCCGFPIVSPTAQPRGTLWCDNDPDNARKLFVKGKNNLAPRDQATLALGITAREVGIDKRTEAPITAPYIAWHPDPVDITAVKVMQAAANQVAKCPRWRQAVS